MYVQGPWNCPSSGMIFQLNANGSFKCEFHNSRRLSQGAFRQPPRAEHSHHQVEGRWLLLEAPLDTADKLVFFGRCNTLTSTPIAGSLNVGKTRIIDEQWRFQISLADIRQSAWRRGLP